MNTKGPATLARMMVACGVGIGAAVIGWASPAAASAPVNPVADSYVDAANPSSNFGDRAYMRADASPDRRAYLKFSLSGTNGANTGLLRLYAETGNAGISVHSLANTSWGESSITYNNAPAPGAVIATTGRITAGTWIDVNISSAINGDGPVAFVITTADGTALKITSREGTHSPQLVVPAPANPSPFLVSKVGSQYVAASQTTSSSYTGTLKYVVESAVGELRPYSAGGTINFTAGTFDFGAEFFKLEQVHNLTFQGAGMDQTIIQNNNSTAADTEPFNFGGAFHITVRDLTVIAGGAPRTTSDALDFDQGNDVLVERVKVNGSRGRGIVFDGKNDSWTSLNNTVRDCVITNTDSDGIELLASSHNTITGCTITNVGGHGIQLVKSSTLADQANKPANDNIISGNTIDQAGQDGINVTSSNGNLITGNVVTNSSNLTTGRDGIRITFTDSIACNDNVVSNNTATDNQAIKTQKYGLNITGSLCNATVVGPDNNFAGNHIAAIHDLGTATIYL